ncbi:uncharacterized protein C2845_PM11G04690 [Panicum miliaceum]|uniref:Uncharacterized protein n=1 Tax=Panicum miliaceum TaxID=4540 RepID=A0A3L6RPP7_PANMI|nr:uncharacterized protein C2845_PM11G04690 [Panicum miliaceum]
MLAPTLTQLKEKLSAAAGPDGHVGAAALGEALQIPQEQAALALGTLAAVLPAEDPTLGDGAGDAASADIRDVLLFLYIQSYKRLVLQSTHKDSPAVADVCPSTSAFDGYLSALSPIQTAHLQAHLPGGHAGVDPRPAHGEARCRGPRQVPGRCAGAADPGGAGGARARHARGLAPSCGPRARGRRWGGRGRGPSTSVFNGIQLSSSKGGREGD